MSGRRTPRHPRRIGSLLRLLVFAVVAAGVPVVVAVGMHWG